MKTIKVRFLEKFAVQASILFFSLEMVNLCSWAEEDFTDTTVYMILKLEDSKSGIPADLKVEKIKEKTFIKILNIQ